MKKREREGGREKGAGEVSGFVPRSPAHSRFFNSAIPDSRVPFPIPAVCIGSQIAIRPSLVLMVRPLLRMLVTGAFEFTQDRRRSYAGTAHSRVRLSYLRGASPLAT